MTNHLNSLAIQDHRLMRGRHVWLADITEFVQEMCHSNAYHNYTTFIYVCVCARVCVYVCPCMHVESPSVCAYE